MQISVSKALAVNTWPKPKPSLSTSWLTVPCPCSIRKNNLLAPKFPNTTILNTSRHSSNGLQLERKLPYLLKTCSVLCTPVYIQKNEGQNRGAACPWLSKKSVRVVKGSQLSQPYLQFLLSYRAFLGLRRSYNTSIFQ